MDTYTGAWHRTARHGTNGDYRATRLLCFRRSASRNRRKPASWISRKSGLDALQAVVVKLTHVDVVKKDATWTPSQSAGCRQREHPSCCFSSALVRFFQAMQFISRNYAASLWDVFLIVKHAWIASHGSMASFWNGFSTKNRTQKDPLFSLVKKYTKDQTSAFISQFLNEINKSSW